MSVHSIYRDSFIVEVDQHCNIRIDWDFDRSVTILEVTTIQRSLAYMYMYM